MNPRLRALGFLSLPRLPHEGSKLFYYEGRTIRGLGLIVWALFIELGALIVTAVSLAALALVLGPALANPPALLPSVLGILAAVCGIEVGQVAMIVVFLSGFHQVHAGRHEYGIEHARSLDRAVLYLVLFSVLELANAAYMISTDLFAPTAGVSPAEPLLVGNVVLAPVAACFAGLTLVYSARRLAVPPDRRRLATGFVLGITGAAAGPALLALATAANPHDLAAIVSGFLAAAIAGDGMAALSIIVFILVFRDLRRNLVEGRPAPSLPQMQQLYPWPAVAAARTPPPRPRDPLERPPG